LASVFCGEQFNWMGFEAGAFKDLQWAIVGQFQDVRHVGSSEVNRMRVGQRKFSLPDFDPRFQILRRNIDCEFAYAAVP